MWEMFGFFGANYWNDVSFQKMIEGVLFQM